MPWSGVAYVAAPTKLHVSVTVYKIAVVAAFAPVLLLFLFPNRLPLLLRPVAAQCILHGISEDVVTERAVVPLMATELCSAANLKLAILANESGGGGLLQPLLSALGTTLRHRLRTSRGGQANALDGGCCRAWLFVPGGGD